MHFSRRPRSGSRRVLSHLDKARPVTFVLYVDMCFLRATRAYLLTLFTLSTESGNCLVSWKVGGLFHREAIYGSYKPGLMCSRSSTPGLTLPQPRFYHRQRFAV